MENKKKREAYILFESKSLILFPAFCNFIKKIWKKMSLNYQLSLFKKNTKR